MKKSNLQNGQVMLTIVVFFMFASITIAFGIINPIVKQVAIAKNLNKSNGSFYLAQSAVEDVYYRLKNNETVGTSETLALNSGTTTTVTSDTATGKKISSSATVIENYRKMETNLLYGTGVAFHYGVQVGNGGFILENSSSVTGNIHSSGPVVGSGNIVRGSVISSGATGVIDGIHATGTAFAHTIRNSDIDGDAYYTTISGTTVGGTSHPGSADQTSAEFPIPDDLITEWETDAASGGNATCSSGKYTISSNITIGPKKIPCDLEISGSPTVTLTGQIWVTGNIVIKNTAVVRVSSTLGTKSVALIADNPSNRLTSSTIDLVNSSTFYGSGSVGSFIFLISQNNSAELGGSVDAISMDNSSSGAVLLYASHGLISINNSATLKEVTGYKIKTRNSATIIYDTGLMSSLFDSGPGGGYEIIDWAETQ